MTSLFCSRGTNR